MRETCKAVSQNEESFREIYEQCLEQGGAQASGATRDRYDSMIGTFSKYIEAVREDMFRFAYQCGYEAAMNEVRA